MLAPEGGDTALAAQLATLLSELAQPAGLRVETRPSLSSGELSEQVKLVVALPPSPGLSELATAAPATHFLAVGVPEVEPSVNLWTIGTLAARPDQSAFLAGYLAAAITDDWRVGVISAAGSVAGKSARLGFTNGVYYFCGLCRPAYPPFPMAGYPLAAELTAGSGEGEWQPVIAEFKTWEIQTVYVDPGAASPALLEALAGAGFDLIGAGPRPAGLEDHWAATIGAANVLQSLREAWTAWQAGAEQPQDSALLFTDVNEALFSPGRQALVAELLADLTGGYIDTGVDPATGEASIKEE